MQVQYLCFNMMTFVIFNFILILSCFWIIYRYQHTYRCFTNQSNRKILRHPENWKNIQCRGFRTKKTVPVEKDVAVHEGSYRSLIKPIGFTVMVSICIYYLFAFISYIFCSIWGLNDQLWFLWPLNFAAMISLKMT